MSKLRLDPDDLRVESFSTVEGGPAVGTVHGRMEAEMAAASVWLVSWCDTCNDTCPATCPVTCQQTCAAECVATQNTGACCTASCPHQTYCNVRACQEWITATGDDAGA